MYFLLLGSCICGNVKQQSLSNPHLIAFPSLVIELTPSEEQEKGKKQTEENQGTLMSWLAVKQSRAQTHCPDTTCPLLVLGANSKVLVSPRPHVYRNRWRK